jgi:hypothetical protein
MKTGNFYFQGKGAGFKKSWHVPRPASQQKELSCTVMEGGGGKEGRG